MLGRKKTQWAEFEALVRAHHRDFLLLAHRVVGDANLTEDVLQEAYLRAYRSYDRGNFTNENLNGWLYRIVYNCSIDALRRRERRPETPSEKVDQIGETRVSEAPEPGAALERALAALALEDRAAVILVDALGFDYAGAANVLAVPAGTIASRLHRARAALRSQLVSETETRRRA